MTAEFAVALPAIALVLAAALASVHAVALQVRLEDAAADAARALGRGDSVDTATGIAGRLVGGSSLSVVVDGAFVCATLSASPSGVLGALEVRATSCAMRGGL
ncbi:TadE family type IV pilus minor pilin [Agromyces sp. SYSU T00266]|uniref:TadE family type IV pilus minor pilin n=1 Tax=Agromyces zhanjiangensis TaxID=3158562 RepID=UPI003395F1B6